MEERERNEKKNNIIIKGIKGERKNLKEMARKFMEEEFEIKEEMKDIKVIWMKGREMIIIQLEI